MNRVKIILEPITPHVAKLPEVGDTLLRRTRKLDDQLEFLIKLYNEIVEEKQDLLEEIKELWSESEILEIPELLNILTVKKIS